MAQGKVNMKVSDIADLISVREFAVRNLDNVWYKMSSEEVKILRNKIVLMDRQILDAMIQLELTVEDKKQESPKKKNETAKQS